MTERELLESGLLEIIHRNPLFSPQAVDKLLQFSKMLLDKNRCMNLTAVTEPREVVTRHLLDCAALAPYITAGESVLDIGTGAGFPGIPLAILTGGKFTLLDAQRKRVCFLEEVIQELALKNCIAVQARAEDFAKSNRERFDRTVSRAVAALRVLCELSLPMLRQGGVFLAMKAEGCQTEIDEAAHTILRLGGDKAEVLPYTVPHTDTKRVLVKIVKTSPTPESYPRRYKRILTTPL